jgi:hypothetical protein
MKQSRRTWFFVSLLGASLLGGVLARSFAPGPAQAAAPAAFGPSTKVTLMDVPNRSTDPDLFGATAVKIADVGTFVVENSASLVEVTHNGRLLVDNMTGTTGVYFELRVDDANGIAVAPGVPSGLGLVRAVEINQYVASSFSGYWQDLPAGTHTVSMWGRTATGAGQGDNALIDPGGWASSVVIVKEYLPFGATFLPLIDRQ